ncbi:WD40 repeat domain-containing protein [Arachnia propionica]|uniref:WD40 repeat domain-containing protein n=2 Tax=Arachnia propionica TaxID=1750 RepID=A0A3P1WVA1_9ACTN|nr:WD40 repeat domain-containing protein [Arachnia propionica]
MPHWPLCQTGPMTNAPPGIRCVAWSPDGSRVAGGTWEAEVIVWDPRTGEVLQELIHSDQPAVQQAGSMEVVAFSPDGERLLSGHETGSLVIWDAAGNATLRLELPDFLASAGWSTDGGHVWALTQDDQLLLFDATTGARTTLRSSRP